MLSGEIALKNNHYYYYYYSKRHNFYEIHYNLIDISPHMQHFFISYDQLIAQEILKKLIFLSAIPPKSS